jgi:small subunit ribosomal protein S3
MIEREFIAQKTKEYYIKKYIENKLNKVGVSLIKLKKIPLGEKIIIHTSRPSLIVGSKGSNIKDLTKTLKSEFKLENPQIEIVEVKDVFLHAPIVAEQIASSLERFGSARFKGVGHKVMQNVMNSGAMGVEIILSGKIPGARAKSWRFYMGYLKKCGDVAIEGVRKAHTAALLKSGIIGIKVAIMPPNLVLPDSVEILAEPEQVVEEIVEKSQKKSEKKAKKKTTKKKATKKDTKGETKGHTKKDSNTTKTFKTKEESKPIQNKDDAKTKESVKAESQQKETDAEEVTKNKDLSEESPKAEVSQEPSESTEQ